MRKLEWEVIHGMMDEPISEEEWVIFNAFE